MHHQFAHDCKLLIYLLCIKQVDYGINRFDKKIANLSRPLLRRILRVLSMMVRVSFTMTIMMRGSGCINRMVCYIAIQDLVP